MAQQNPGPNVQTGLSDAAIAANKLVKRTTTAQQVSIAGYGDKVAGVTLNKSIAADEELNLITDGTMKLTLSGAATRGDDMIAAAAGEVKKRIVLTGVTAEADDNLFTKAAHGLIAGDKVTVSAKGGGTLPTGIVEGQKAFVIATGLTANVFSLSLTAGGAAIDITGDGTGLTISEVADEGNYVGTMESASGVDNDVVEVALSIGAVRV